MNTPQVNHAERVDRGARMEMLSAELRVPIGDLRQSVLDQFSHSPLDDKKLHRLLRLYLQVLEDFEQRMLIYIKNGEVSRDKIVKLN